MTTPALVADSLSKTYRANSRQKVQALKDFSLEVAPGEIFGLLGPNGAGKTTFVKILLSLTHPTGGSATIFDARLPSPKVRERIGFLPENHRFPGHLTGTQVLQLFGGLSGVPREELARRIPTLMEMTGIAQWGRVKTKRYSKGMLQRLGLAQALLNDPDILFLDEPTDGVDPVGRKEIRDLLRELRLKGKTIFLNSHLLSEVELVSDRVAILDRGTLLKVGTVDELTTSGSTYHVGFEGLIPDAFRLEADATVFKISYQPELLSIDLTTTEELNRLIDLLRRHGVRITSVARHRTSLEDSFLSLLKREVAQ